MSDISLDYKNVKARSHSNSFNTYNINSYKSELNETLTEMCSTDSKQKLKSQHSKTSKNNAPAPNEVNNKNDSNFFEIVS